VLDTLSIHKLLPPGHLDIIGAIHKGHVLTEQTASHNFFTLLIREHLQTENIEATMIANAPELLTLCHTF
jgi:hypothetical protein